MPQIDVSGEKLESACETLADTVDCTVVDGGYRLEDGQGLYITKPQNGERLDSTALKTALEQHLERRDLSAIECTYKEQPAAPLDLQAIHDELEGQVVSAVCDKATGKPTQSHVGVAFDVEKGTGPAGQRRAGDGVPGGGGGGVPSVTTEELETAMFRDVLGTSTTKCAGPWGRHQNIRLAARAINGRIYNPGEAFGTTPPWVSGRRNGLPARRGLFRRQDRHVHRRRHLPGVVHAYYAALLGDLEIVLRYAHMFDLGYMPVTGCDATVSWGGPDFAFRNDTDYPIKIVTSYNDDTNELTVTIMGTKRQRQLRGDDQRLLSYSGYETVYQEDVSVAPGESVTEQSGHNGYAVQTYRNVYAGDGTLLHSTKEAYSDYDRSDKIVLVAPGSCRDKYIGKKGAGPPEGGPALFCGHKGCEISGSGSYTSPRWCAAPARPSRRTSAFAVPPPPGRR